MAHSRSKTLSGSIDLCACRAAWESVNVHGGGGEKGERFMVAYILWSRLADFITGEEKHRTDVQTRFLKD
jgi:hypothetical protein